MSDAVRIVVLVDATGSMGSYCSSVGQTLKQLFAVLDVLFGGAAAVDIVSYEDYCDGDRVLKLCEASSGRISLRDFAAKLKAGGGGDAPEAVKTALNRVLEIVQSHDSAGRTVVIHYTDAPPHHPKLVDSDQKNLSKERGALKGKEPGFDWVKICRTFRKIGTPVITFMARKIAYSQTGSFMCMLGDVICMPDTNPETITRYTMGVLLQLMGQPFDDISRLEFSTPVDFKSLGTEDSIDFTAQLKAPTREAEGFAAHEAFRRDLKQLTVRFQQSESFCDTVFEALKELFVPQCVLAITYNNVLGLLWRLVCKRREDPRVQPLCDALSSCCTSLSGESQSQLRKWVDESYNQLEEIREMISAVKDPLSEGVLVLDVSNEEDLPTKEEMRSILHAPTPGVMRKVQGLLTRLIVVKSGELPVKDRGGEEAPMYIPLALKDKQLFSMLSHLLLPGMLSSLRPAAMLAILAHLSGNATLQPRAKAFLDSIKGNWIPPVEKVEDYPEILNGEFVRLVVRAQDFLTEDEAALYKHLAQILRVRRAAKLRVPVQVGYTPQLKDLTPDIKIPCESCGHRRSMTLMVDGTCGLCLCKDNPREPDGTWSNEHPEPAEDMSRMVECRTCNALYAVVNTDSLNVHPKCHFCRERVPCESVTCVKCSNKFCAPTASTRVKDFVCAVCSAEPAKGLPEREVEFAELAERNPAAICCLGLGEAARKPLFDRLGLYKLWMSHKDDLAAVEPTRLESLTFAGKPVMNAAAVFDFIVEQVQRGRLAQTCNLCFEERPLALLQSSCGACQNLACQDCLRRWYGRLAPGKLYVPSEGLCAFCKRTPKARTLRTFNRLACRLAGRRTLELRADMYYGWCRSCFQIAEAVPRECAEEPPAFTAFECEACKAKKLLRDEESLEKNSKSCPACKAPTVKISGCNHISCPCGAHWCWQCGGQFDESEIYEHMDREHGSIGLDDEGEDFSEDEG